MTDFLVRHFIKNAEHVTDSRVRNAYGNFACIVGIICNIFLFGLKLTIGLFSGSVAVLADAFNNLSDMGSSVILLVGLRMSRKPADPEHPFGHGRMEYVSGFIVSIVIIIVGFELLKNSFFKIFSPESLNISGVVIIGLVASVAVKFWMFLFNRKLSRRIRSEALKATSVDSLSDCAATTAVILSVVVDRYAGVNIDAYMGILVAAFIIYNGIGTAKDTMNPLLGTPPSKELVCNIRTMILAHKDFVGIHDLIIHNYGPGRIFVSVHVEVPADIDIVHCHEEIDACEKEICRELDVQVVIHMDPIATDDEVINTARIKMAHGIKQIDPRITIHDFRMVSGEQRSNLIFDVVLPVGWKPSKDEMDSRIEQIAKEIDPTYACVVTYDVDLD